MKPMFLAFVLLLVACAPSATIKDPSGNQLQLVRSARVVSIAGATKMGDGASIAGRSVHEIVLTNNYSHAKQFTFSVRSQKGIVGLRIFADAPAGSNSKVALEDFTSNEQKGAKISNPSSKTFYFYLYNRGADSTNYTFTFVAE